jgi:hypothetical protein
MRHVEALEAILVQLPRIAWFSAAGSVSERPACAAAVAQYLAAGGREAAVRWAESWDDAQRVVRGLDDRSSLWTQEEAWRGEALAAAQASGRSDLLADALHRLSALGYEVVRPALADEELARVASGAALWTVAQALMWASAEGLLAARKNPLLPKLRVYELGHWPLGLSEGAFVVL